jgi:hypothetical protein
MKMIDKKCGEYGTLKYKLPNIPEAMMLLGKMGINSKSFSGKKAMDENELIYLAKLINELDPFISDINLNIDGKIVTTYDELLKHFCMMIYLSEIAGEIFKSLNFSDKKKS